MFSVDESAITTSWSSVQDKEAGVVATVEKDYVPLKNYTVFYCFSFLDCSLMEGYSNSKVDWLLERGMPRLPQVETSTMSKMRNEKTAWAGLKLLQKKIDCVNSMVNCEWRTISVIELARTARQNNGVENRSKQPTILSIFSVVICSSH